MHSMHGLISLSSAAAQSGLFASESIVTDDVIHPDDLQLACQSVHDISDLLLGCTSFDAD